MVREIRSDDVYASVEMAAEKGATADEIAADLFGQAISRADDYADVLKTISRRLTGTMNALEPRFIPVKERDSENARWYAADFSPKKQRERKPVSGFDYGARTTPYTIEIRDFQANDPGVTVAVHRDPLCIQGVLKLQVRVAERQWEQIPLFVGMEIWITSGDEPKLHPRQISLRGLSAIQLVYRDSDNSSRGRQEEIQINKDQIVVITPLNQRK